VHPCKRLNLTYKWFTQSGSGGTGRHTIDGPGFAHSLQVSHRSAFIFHTNQLRRSSGERPVSPGKRRKRATVAKTGAVSLFSSVTPRNVCQYPGSTVAGAPTLDVPRCMFRPLRALPRTSVLQRLLPWLATSPPIANAVKPQLGAHEGNTRDPRGDRLGIANWAASPQTPMDLGSNNSVK